MGRTCCEKLFGFVNLDKRNREIIFKIDLQLFADPDKTEEPTPRRLQRAREEGNIPVSRELTMALSFLVMVGMLWIIISPLSFDLKRIFQDYLNLEIDWVGPNLLGIGIKEHQDLYFKLAILILGSAAFATLLSMLQTKFLFAPKALKFDLNRLNPITGFKRLFSLRSVYELMKNIIKLAIIGYIAYTIIKDNWDKVISLPAMGLIAEITFIFNLILNAAIKIGIIMLIFGFVDYFYQRHEYKKNLRMTKYEVKQEMKDVEGNPEVRARQRQMMRKIVSMNLRERVAAATVVITNPTHYAVAIKYEFGNSEPPKVVAKGIDEIAKRIMEIARENNIPIYRDPPLARLLYSEVDIDEYIPTSLYEAVAKIIATLYREELNV